MKASTRDSYWSKAIVLPWQRFKFLCQEMKVTWKTEGFKALISRYGWKFFALVFCYYLVRDVTLYILIPYFVATMDFR
jgi:hypothetical protein